MKKIITAGAFALSMMVMASPSYATWGHAGGYDKPDLKQIFQKIEQAKEKKHKKIAKIIKSKKNHHSKKKERCNTVPEMDAAGAGLALALAGGIVSIARERRRKQK